MRPGGSCSRWSEALLRSTYGATLRTRRSWSSWAARRRASRAPRSRKERERDSLKRSLAVSGVSRADPHSPFPFPLSVFIRPRAIYFRLSFITRKAVSEVSVALRIVSTLLHDLLQTLCRKWTKRIRYMSPNGLSVLFCRPPGAQLCAHRRLAAGLGHSWTNIVTSFHASHLSLEQDSDVRCGAYSLSPPSSSLSSLGSVHSE